MFDLTLYVFGPNYRGTKLRKLRNSTTKYPDGGSPGGQRPRERGRGRGDGGGGGRNPGAAGLESYTQKSDIFFFPLHSNPFSSPGVILTWNSLPKSPWVVPDALASFK